MEAAQDIVTLGGIASIQFRDLPPSAALDQELLEVGEAGFLVGLLLAEDYPLVAHECIQAVIDRATKMGSGFAQRRRRLAELQDLASRLLAGETADDIIREVEP